MTALDLEAENRKLRSLLDECHTAMVAGGFHDDSFLRRVKAEGLHAATGAKIHSRPLAQPKDQ
jgi:hypothetical protein